MLEDKKIGIVTVLYNSEKVLDGFFQSLNGQTYKNFVLYAVDNNSPDESLKRIKALMVSSSFETILIEETNNWGVAKGNNIGISKALEDGCDYILLSNNDIEFGGATIENLFSGLRRNLASMVVPKVLYFDSGRIWMAGGEFINFLGICRQYGCSQVDNGQYDVEKRITYAPTCFMLIEKSVFGEIGLMDEKYFVYYDDTDFVWRVTMKRHLPMFYIPSSVVRHKVSSSTGGSESDFTKYFSSRNFAYFTKKNYSYVHFLYAISFDFFLHIWHNVKNVNHIGLKKLLHYYKEGIRLCR